ncbi:hypothetical protein GCL60_06515 [Silvanigrella paludirubra]|uniref:Uncharacterized protein n=1 Tax=Silvanigrella paludirubra TaxID=2499159 RepID=A0A6N6VUA7_9BACT|nr:hypothetical protein [Silvanigrella paludirubra]KAB8039910.1 hypothetical protein GCL60_06515 [Silvanigrella paludirubra]
MKKILFIKIFVSMSVLYFISSANAQYFKPSIDGSWLISFEKIKPQVTSNNYLLNKWKSIFFNKYFKTSTDETFRLNSIVAENLKFSKDIVTFKADKYIV